VCAGETQKVYDLHTLQECLLLNTKRHSETY
jgi:hypothetical protein